MSGKMTMSSSSTKTSTTRTGLVSLTWSSRLSGSKVLWPRCSPWMNRFTGDPGAEILRSHSKGSRRLFYTLRVGGNVLTHLEGCLTRQARPSQCQVTQGLAVAGLRVASHRKHDVLTGVSQRPARLAPHSSHPGGCATAAPAVSPACRYALDVGRPHDYHARAA